ncbi:hypothetical protein R8Z50_08550 [Longispora sp. K20-0274]|uniref:hypothetical protein n=1 Tax=Longispora sp. K20-0274 TaxID=3088255 RepID=UPI00399A4846
MDEVGAGGPGVRPWRLRDHWFGVLFWVGLLAGACWLVLWLFGVFDPEFVRPVPVERLPEGPFVTPAG